MSQHVISIRVIIPISNGVRPTIPIFPWDPKTQNWLFRALSVPLIHYQVSGATCIPRLFWHQYDFCQLDGTTEHLSEKVSGKVSFWCISVIILMSCHLISTIKCQEVACCLLSPNCICLSQRTSQKHLWQNRDFEVFIHAFICHIVTATGAYAIYKCIRSAFWTIIYYLYITALTKIYDILISCWTLHF